jgi:MFS family permease
VTAPADTSAIGAVVVATADASQPPLRRTLREAGVSFYPLAALGTLSLIDTFQGQAFTVLSPDIGRDLGMSVTAMSSAIAVKTLAASVGPLPVALLSQRPGRRVTLVLITAVAWSVLTLFSGFTTSAAALLVLLALDGFSTGSVTALHSPLLMDFYPPQARVRILSMHTSAQFLGNVVAPLLVAVFSGVFGLGWRGVFIAMGTTSVLGTLAAVRLRDPGHGRWETAPSLGDEVPGLKADCRALLAVPTLRRIFAGFAVFGLLAVPLAVFLSLFLKDHWGLNATQRALFFAFTSLMSIAGLVAYGRRGERVFVRDPSRMPLHVSSFFAVTTVLVMLGGLSPSLPLMIVLFGVGYALIGPVVVGLQITALSLVDSRSRPLVQAIASICIALGGLVGAVALGGVADSFGIVGSLLSIGVPGLIAAVVVRRAATTVVTDLTAYRTALLTGGDADA